MEVDMSVQMFQIFIPTILCLVENERVNLMAPKPQLSLSSDMIIWGEGVTGPILNPLLGECMA